MGAHLIEGEFQSDKYPTCPRGKVPLSVKDETAQDLLWEYAQRRREVDEEFSDDLEAALRTAGFDPASSEWISPMNRIAKAAGVEDADTFGEILFRVEALHNAVLGSHRQVTDPGGGPDFCADCGADIEDAMTDGLICPAGKRRLADGGRISSLSPTDAEWYSLLAAMANGDFWPTGADSGDVRRCLRAALDKINALESRATLERSVVDAAKRWQLCWVNEEGEQDRALVAAETLLVEAVDALPKNEPASP
jgi:hypothetical protein